MRKLAILATVLSGCSGDIADLGGFTLVPSISAVPAYQSALGLGYSSDGTLWLTYVTGDTYSRKVWPARLVGDRWEIGSAYESSASFMGMHPDGPALSVWGHPGAAVRYAGGAWWQQAAPSPSLAPDGRLYSQYGDGTEDLRISAYSPAWDAVEQDAVALSSAERDSWWNYRVPLAFSSSGQPVFEYLVSKGSSVLGFRRWDGSAWVKAADDLDVGIGFHTSTLAKLDVDSQGRIWLMPGQTPTATWRWTGGAWEDLGPFAENLTPGEAGEGNPPYTQIVAKIDSQDRLVVAWAEASSMLTSTTLSMRRYGAAGWEDLGPPIQTHGPAYTPTLAIAPDGTPTIAWISGREGGVYTGVRVVRYAGE